MTQTIERRRRAGDSGGSSKGRTVGKKGSAQDLKTFTGRIGANIRARRESLGHSAGEIHAKLEAAGLSLSLATLYNWESGHAPIPVDALPFIATALRTSVKRLLPDA